MDPQRIVQRIEHRVHQTFSTKYQIQNGPLVLNFWWGGAFCSTTRGPLQGKAAVLNSGMQSRMLHGCLASRLLLPCYS